MKNLGWKVAPCRIVATLDDAILALKAELSENTCREPLDFTAIVALGKKIEALEKPKAKERKSQAKGESRGAKKVSSGKFPEQTTGQTRDKVASALGVSGKTYEKAKQIDEAAAHEPEKHSDLLAVAKGQRTQVYAN